MQALIVNGYADKQCSRCRLRRPLTSFSLARGQPDGLYAYCRSCQRVLQRTGQPRPVPAKGARTG